MSEVLYGSGDLFNFSWNVIGIFISMSWDWLRKVESGCGLR